jgi:nucleotide-binding universal stress UspA family protein
MFRHILIPTDGSELAERAVSRGVALAKEQGAKITALIVSRPFHVMTLESRTNGEVFGCRFSGC